MKFNYLNVLSENNLSESDLSVSLKKIIGDLKKYAGVYDQMAAQINSGSLDPDELEEKKKQYEELGESLEAIDASLVKKIPVYIKNKPRYDELVQKMHSKTNDKKKGEGTETPPATPPEVKPVVKEEGGKVEGPAVTTTSAATTVTTTIEPEKNKNNGLGAVLGFLVIAGLAAFGIKMYKDRQG